jgi:hypothetical protein
VSDRSNSHPHTVDPDWGNRAWARRSSANSLGTRSPSYSLGQHGGVIEARVEHGPGQARALGDGADCRHEDKRVHWAVGALVATEIHEVIEQPDRVEALLIRHPGLVDDGVDAEILMQEHADFHSVGNARASTKACQARQLPVHKTPGGSTMGSPRMPRDTPRLSRRAFSHQASTRASHRGKLRRGDNDLPGGAPPKSSCLSARI